MYAEDDFKNEEGDRDSSERHVKGRDVLLEACKVHLRGRLWDEREEHKEEEVRHRLAQVAGPAECETEGLREDPEADEDIPDVIVAVMLCNYGDNDDNNNHIYEQKRAQGSNQERIILFRIYILMTLFARGAKWSLVDVAQALHRCGA